MSARYVVRHAFSYKDVYYTRGNADAIETLPKAVQDAQVRKGHIVDTQAGTKAAKPEAEENVNP